MGLLWVDQPPVVPTSRTSTAWGNTFAYCKNGKWHYVEGVENVPAGLLELPHGPFPSVESAKDYTKGLKA